MNATQSSGALQTTMSSRTNDVTTAFLAERAAVIQLAAIQQRRTDEIAEKRAARLVKAVEVCRLVIPSVLIAMIIASAHLKQPDAMADRATVGTEPSQERSFAAEYFPEQYLNQAVTVSDHVEAF